MAALAVASTQRRVPASKATGLASVQGTTRSRKYRDDAIAVAAAAKDSLLLLITGLAISIPVMIFGSTLLLKVLGRFPLLVWFGAALLGFIAGALLVSDPALAASVERVEEWAHLSRHTIAILCGVAGALLVVALGMLLGFRAQRAATG